MSCLGQISSTNILKKYVRVRESVLIYAGDARHIIQRRYVMTKECAKVYFKSKIKQVVYVIILKATKSLSKNQIEEQEKELSEKLNTKVVIIPNGLEIIGEGK